MSTTPSRRLSLRRKRGTKGAQDTGSPASKKSSPLLETVSDEESGQLSGSQVYTSRRTRSHSSATHTPQPSRTPLTSIHQSLCSPKFQNSINVKSQERNYVTPQTRCPQPPHDEILRQHSPDMPFLCSQLCSTQECEVVWDCDSPGFSKADLKRMHGDGSDSDGVSPLVKSAQATHRTLFSWARTKPTTAAAITAAGIKNTTSQLNQLLDQLSNKSKVGDKKDVDDEPLLNLAESQNEDSSSTQRTTSSSSPQLPRLLQATASQPFTLHERNSQEYEGNIAAIEKEDVLNSPSLVDDSVWGDDLNMGICDISGINLASDESRIGLPSVRGSETFSPSGIKATGALVDIPCETSDVFDDDLFNESVMQTTQAVEKALIKSDELQGPVESQGNNRQLVESKVSENYYTSASAKETKGDCAHEKHKIESITSSKLNYDLMKQNSSSDDCSSSSSSSSSPVLGKPQTSPLDKPPQRHVRNSFRIGTLGHSPQKRSVPFVQKHPKPNPDKHLDRRNLDNQFKINPVLPEKQAKSTSAYAEPVTSFDSKPSQVLNSSRAEIVNNLSSSTAFRGNGSNNETEIYCTARMQTQRGSFLRSQSTGDAKVTSSNNTLALAKRSNSSAEMDALRELEEDEDIFKSLLTAFPDDDMLLEGQILPPPQVDVSKHNTANIKQDDTPLINSTIITENSKSCIRVGAEKGNNLLVAQRNPLGNVTNGPTRKLFNLESTEARKTEAHTSTKKQTSTTWTLFQKSGTKEDGGKQVCASRTKKTELDHTLVQFQTNDMLDDDLFEDDILSLIDEVESQYGSQASQQQHNEPSSSQPSQSQLVQCTQDEIARKKEAAQRLRKERKQQRHCPGQYHSVC